MAKTNVLILGSGGREHALGWKLKQSPRCGKLFFAPGNAGTDTLGENVPLKIDPVDTKHCDAIDFFARKQQVGLIVVGPEDPLAGGIVDRLTKLGHRVFGPTAAAARLEADKAYAKQLMRSASIPTAEARTFTLLDPALSYVESRDEPLVVKAAGLCKGKGVVVCSTPQQAAVAVRDLMEKKIFGDAGATVVIEEKLTGQEVSILALVDGRNLYVLEPAQDHKQVHEGDKGPNTGGMGAYSPTPLIDDAMMTLVERQVLVPIVDVLRREGVEFKGVLYAGLMLTPAGPKVLEFNTRFGDPETQVLLMRLKGDLMDLIDAVIDGRLDEVSLDWDPRCACCVVMASGGYPGDYATGKPISGLSAPRDDDVLVFHGGTKRDKDGQVLTAGGRVLNVVALGDTLKDAQHKANAACEPITFDGAHFRRDIGFRVM